SWGSSEMRHTRLPICGGNNDAPAYFVDALKAGARFGVIASSDDHATLPGSVNHFRTPPYSLPFVNGFAHKGLAAVRAPRLTRAALFEAMQRRSTYATTHVRSLLDFSIADAGMGQAVAADAALRRRRELRLRLTLQTTKQACVTLMRNGEAVDVRKLQGPAVTDSVNEIVFEDVEPLETVALRDAPYHPAPFAVYYIRVEDGTGAHQWTSPIWIDL
ncbi:MAG: DUF3604 domain-containing protein, partial [Kiritimatiellia bacterium]|nr:DUF3604 domain-containing protein [Lentisphaerota bacterium]